MALLVSMVATVAIGSPSQPTVTVTSRAEDVDTGFVSVAASGSSEWGLFYAVDSPSLELHFAHTANGGGDWTVVNLADKIVIGTIDGQTTQQPNYFPSIAHDASRDTWAVTWKDGNGTGADRRWHVAWTQDNGASWSRAVAYHDQGKTLDHPRIEVRDGVWYVIGLQRPAAGGDLTPALAVSSDGGSTWANATSTGEPAENDLRNGIGMAFPPGSDELHALSKDESSTNERVAHYLGSSVPTVEFQGFTGGDHNASNFYASGASAFEGDTVGFSGERDNSTGEGHGLTTLDTGSGDWTHYEPIWDNLTTSGRSAVEGWSDSNWAIAWYETGTGCGNSVILAETDDQGSTWTTTNLCPGNWALNVTQTETTNVGMEATKAGGSYIIGLFGASVIHVTGSDIAFAEPEAPAAPGPTPVDLAQGLQDFAAGLGFVSANSQFFFALILVGIATVSMAAAMKFVGAGDSKNAVVLGTAAVVGVFSVLVQFIDLWQLFLALVLGVAMIRAETVTQTAFKAIREDVQQVRQAGGAGMEATMDLAGEPPEQFQQRERVQAPPPARGAEAEARPVPEEGGGEG